MNFLKFVWPSLGQGVFKTTRNTSWTKKGPGRRHQKLSKRQIEIRAGNILVLS